jgi:flagellar protein FliS
MSPHSSQYKAYSIATRTVAKTRQVVMLYDGTIRFIKQAMQAISDNRIEERYNLLTKASEVLVGLQNSIDFDTGGEIANVLHAFYVRMSRRIIMINFNKDAQSAIAQCNEIIDELKQMRDIWDQIDHSLNKPDGEGSSSSPDSAALSA